MPTYDYICNECGERFEHFQPMSSQPLTEYPHCKEEDCTVQRLISGGSGLIFKGSGFYLTDYGKGKDQKKKADGQNGKEKKTTKTDKTKEKKTENKKSK